MPPSTRRVAPRPLPAWQLPPAFLEDTAAVARYAFRHQFSKEEWEARLLLRLPPEQRSSSIAALHGARLGERMRKEGKCERCMFQFRYCVCERLQELSRQASEYQVGRRVRFVVWMHQMERKRASNTGKLLEHILPGSEVLLHDVPADAERLRDLVAMASGRAIVLYPSEGAVPAAEVQALLPAPPGNGAAPLAFLAVLVDGTWRQAKRMHRALEGLPHVALSGCGYSEFHWRRQTQEGRISTVEAAAILLEELGEEPQGAPAALRRSLQELNSALERQCHYDTFVAGRAAPEPSAKKQASLRHKLPKRGPGQRGGGVERSDSDDEP